MRIEPAGVVTLDPECAVQGAAEAQYERALNLILAERELSRAAIILARAEAETAETRMKELDRLARLLAKHMSEEKQNQYSARLIYGDQKAPA